MTEPPAPERIAVVWSPEARAEAIGQENPTRSAGQNTPNPGRIGQSKTARAAPQIGTAPAMGSAAKEKILAFLKEL
jgi:hypothetical protein